MYTAIPRQHELPEPCGFGTVVDNLDIDFDAPDRTHTAVLVVACLSKRIEDEPDLTQWAWSLPVSSRTLQLLRIVHGTQGSEELTARLSCLNSACREALELQLPLSALIAHGQEALNAGPELTWELEPTRAITFRRATGLDQRAWLQQRFGDPNEANRALLASLLVRGDMHLDALDATKQHELSEALRDFDPLAAFRVATQCPACGVGATHPVDLERACLDRLRKAQMELFESIHRLAKSHGWSESEILGLAPRRSVYLSLIEREEVAP